MSKPSAKYKLLYAKSAVRDIWKLDRVAKEKFLETFEKIQKNFQDVFSTLFEGGAARIYLEEDEDPLDAKIMVNASPSGKKMRGVTLLSGGERALATVALLFAIFQAKPSPFCVLDEVDAPLDDSNVERFLMLLEDFRKDTQFVIVTHNKLTMGVAEVLYGLTMTDGVSKKISVRFEDVDRSREEASPRRAKAG